MLSYIYPRYFGVHVMATELRARCVRVADGNKNCNDALRM